jgi:hypothetical protein
MQLDPVAFNNLIAGMGQRAHVRRSFVCPCLNPHSKAHQPGCPICGGKGRAWDEGKDVVIGSAGARQQRKWEQTGMYESGDVVLVLPSDSFAYGIGEFDRITLLDTTVAFSRVMTMGAAPALARRMVSVDRAFALRGSVIHRFPLPTLTADGGLSPTWPDGPAAGEQFSLSGRENPEYFVFGAGVQDRPVSGAALPRKVVARRFDLYGR